MAELRTILQKVDEDAGVAWLTFNRPEKKNALSQRLMIEMVEALKELSDNDKIKCVVTTGSGDSYSSGLDLYDLRENWKRKRPWDQAGSTYEIVRLLRNMPQVTVAAVRGWCLGGGLALINGHDLCIAAITVEYISYREDVAMQRVCCNIAPGVVVALDAFELALLLGRQAAVARAIAQFGSGCEKLLLKRIGYKVDDKGSS